MFVIELIMGFRNTVKPFRDRLACNHPLVPHKHAVMCQYWADAISIGPVLAHNGMFTGLKPHFNCKSRSLSLS